jgi:PAS domain S-box-containing protein
MSLNLKNNSRLNILLVEDEQADRMMISKAVHASGFEIAMKYAENIEDALTMTSIHSFDCILLDYYFSGSSNGFDFIRNYRASRGEAPIIMVTSYNEPALVVESMKLGVADYIAKKDISPESIAKSIHYILKLREAENNRMLAEKALLESELRLKTIVERSPVIVFTIDSNGYFKLFKGKGVSVLNIKPENIIGHNISDIWQHLPVTLHDYNAALKGINYTTQVETANHHFEVNYIPVVNHQQKITAMMGVAIDITDYKRNEEALLNTIEITEAASKIKEQFLANMSHEIRTPIHGIIGLNQFLCNTELNEEQSHYAELVQKSASSLLTIINDILDLSKIEAGKMQMEEIPFDLRETVAICIESISCRATEKNLAVNISIDKDVPDFLCGDPVRLSQVLNNLVGNSIKFTETGKVDIYICASSKNEGSCIIEIKVSDTGIGIPQSRLPFIFDSFTQAGSDINRKYGGTGLGLTIVKKLIEQQQGTIAAESEVNCGTVFTVKIPYIISETTTVKTTMKKELINALEGIHILVAEDNDINRFIIEKMLKTSGAQLTFAVNGEDAVRFASTLNCNVVLMDIEMPGMNGYQATEIIRNELKLNSIPIIAMTGHAMDGERNKCISCGMNDYISKPFQTVELTDMIAKWIKPLVANEPASQKIMTTKTANCTNLDFLREISDGNEAFFKEFIQLFLKTAPQAIIDLQSSHKQENWELLRQAAHKVKPSFNYVGLKELNQAAARIEELARMKSSRDEISQLINKIETVCTQAFKELEIEIQSGLSAQIK